MSTAVDVDPGSPLGGHDVVGVVSPDARHPLAASPPWPSDSASPAAAAPTLAATTTTTTSATGMVVTKLLTRPKTSIAAQRQTVQYVYGSKCSIQVLGEKLSGPQSSPNHHPQQPHPSAERPRTSVLRGPRQRRDRPGTSGAGKERGGGGGGFVAVQGKDLPLPICTTRDVRQHQHQHQHQQLQQYQHQLQQYGADSGNSRDILSITTKLRNRSAAGSRSIASLMGPTSRDRSAALLKELSQSLALSSFSGGGRSPTSPFKDCLRERWGVACKENAPLYNYGAGSGGRDRDRPLSPLKSLSLQDDEGSSTPSIDGSQCSASKAPKTERSRALSYFKDLKETWNMCSSPTKDAGDLTARSSSPAKERSSRYGMSTKRTRSSGALLNWGHELLRSPRRDAPGKDVVVTSPRIITINRIPSASTASKKENKKKFRERADSGSKPTPRSTLAIPGAALAKGPEDLPPPSSCGVDRADDVQGQSPCNVTTFDMAISPVKSSPRARTASFLSETGQPASVQDDAVLTLCTLYDQPPASPLGKPDGPVSEQTNAPPQQQQPYVLISPRSSETGERPTHGQQDSARGAGPERVKRLSGDEVATDQVVVEAQEGEGQTLTPGLTRQEMTVTPVHGDLDSLQLQSQETPTSFYEEHSKHGSPRVLQAVMSGDEDNEDTSSMSDSSSSTPTVPFSGAELLYGNGEGASRSPHPHPGGLGSSDDVAGGREAGAWDQRVTGDASKKLKELDLHGNKRPASRNSTNRKVPSFDKVSYDRDREELRPIGSSLPTSSKQSPLRANGLKNSLLRPDTFIAQRPNGTAGRDDDLVAMGTLWSPSQLQTRGSSTTTTTAATTSSGKSTSAPNSGSGGNTYGGGGGAAGGGGVSVRRPIHLSTSTSTRQLLHHSNNLSSSGAGMGNGVRKEVEPKYSDPLVGAGPTFQQRLMELASLEAETVRWERTKKVKKKPKADRDS